jgi:hypothetical protein
MMDFQATSPNKMSVLSHGISNFSEFLADGRACR